MEGETAIQPLPTSQKYEGSPQRNYSEETFCTESSDGNSSNKSRNANSMLQKRRKTFTAATGDPYRASASNYGPRYIMITGSKANMSAISQKVLSAKMLRLKQLQNELNDARTQINELATENRMLRTLQKRQDLALNRFEGKQAELPELLNAHSEEVRVLRASIKQLKSQVREMESKLKDRDAELSSLRESYTDLTRLSKDRHLGERDVLQKRVETLKQTNEDQAQTIQMLKRKMMLENKNFRHQLNNEIANHRNTQRELAQALERAAKFQAELEAKQRFIQGNMHLGSRHLLSSSHNIGAAASGSVTSVGSTGQVRFPDVHNLKVRRQDGGKFNKYGEEESHYKGSKDKVSLIHQTEWQFPSDKTTDQLHVQGTGKIGVYSTSSRMKQHQFAVGQHEHEPIQEDTDSDLQQTTGSSAGELYEEDGENSTADISNQSLMRSKHDAGSEGSLQEGDNGSSLGHSRSQSAHGSLSRSSRKGSLTDEIGKNQLFLADESFTKEKLPHANNTEEESMSRSSSLHSGQHTSAQRRRRGSAGMESKSVTIKTNYSNPNNLHEQKILTPKTMTNELQQALHDSSETEYKGIQKEELLASLNAIDRGQEIPFSSSSDLQSSGLYPSKSKSKTDLMRELFGST